MQTLAYLPLQHSVWMVVERLGGIWIINRSCCVVLYTAWEYSLMIFTDPEPAPFPSQPNLLFLLFICLLFFLFIFLLLFFNYSSHPAKALVCGPPRPKRSMETRPCGYVHNNMNGHSGRATSLRTGTQGEGWGRGGGEGEKMGRMERGGKDERREPWFNTYFSLSSLCGRKGILSSLGGFREKGGIRRGEGIWFKSHITGKQVTKLLPILNFYQHFSLCDVTALPRRPIKVNDWGLFSHQSEYLESLLMVVKNLFHASPPDP